MGGQKRLIFFSYNKFMIDIFKNSVMSGDLSKVYGNSGYALAIYNQDKRLSVGDKEVKIGGERD